MTVEEISQLVGGKVRGNGLAQIAGVAQLEAAQAADLAYAEGARALATAAVSRAGCVLAPRGASLPGRTIIEVDSPKRAFIRAARALAPRVQPAPGIHPSAIVAPSARLKEGVYVGPRVVIGDEARVGARTALYAGVTIGSRAVVGADCELHPGVTLYPGSRLGDRVVLHAGVVIGGDGFGYVFSDGRHEKFPQLGGVVIEDDVEIGCNTTVDRGSLGTTVIGAGTKIDNLVQIAHNVRVGRHVVIAAQTGISGSVQIGDYAVIGGQVGVGDHVRIERRAVIGSGSGVLPGKIIREGEVVWGTPSRPLGEIKKLHAYFARLPALARRLEELEARWKR